ncbi:Aldo-keto reductase yakc [NADP(+)] [Schizosaccharomyces pombe]|uniref:Aldo-keto reductase yakc [NADP(+)] n=1 Tax=Schizosaccharomyces pombe (strain 972 / ATCC 24843) TaxID=284812 RepID=YAKC_SCHPO|nr:aldose reductase ARK13 family YakC [Schizosaccharomyces pombe]Q09923.1 RecName: Full=Aldo-keto reductase yakc [NADP(+)] [Schizosaccharomyces pombe 972h-]CAA91959.1 aldose reductase ARK13 family YakC [Schizosaccharomyces pombe]|eukprot:NP_594498.1 aldose reductase ARK13 family YakC [Schizosaccharomyces pombe]
MSIPTRKIGNDTVPAIGFGCMGLHAMYGPSSEEANQAVLTHAADLGCTFWDSSDMYGFGANEECIGRWFKQTGRRKEIFLATKFGYEKNPETGELSLNNEPDYIEKALDLSLKRLGIDCIDLYYVHRFSGETPIEKIMGALKKCVEAGKIRYIGLSECSANTIRRAAAVYPVSAVQVEYSPFSLEIERPEIGVMKACRENNITIVCYAPLGRGFLTGAYKSPDDFPEGDFRRKAPRYQKENFYKNLELVTKIEKIATANNITPGQLSLAWLLAQGDDILPIPGTKRVKYLEENFGALKVKLSDATVKEIREACDNAEVIGARYPPGAGSKIFMDTPPMPK